MGCYLPAMDIMQTNCIVTVDTALAAQTNGYYAAMWQVNRGSKSITFTNAQFTAVTYSGQAAIGAGTNYAITIVRPPRSQKFGYSWRALP
jgi:hypothetical protein